MPGTLPFHEEVLGYEELNLDQIVSLLLHDHREGLEALGKSISSTLWKYQKTI